MIPILGQANSLNRPGFKRIDWKNPINDKLQLWAPLDEKNRHKHYDLVTGQAAYQYTDVGEWWVAQGVFQDHAGWCANGHNDSNGYLRFSTPDQHVYGTHTTIAAWVNNNNEDDSQWERVVYCESASGKAILLLNVWSGGVWGFGSDSSGKYASGSFTDGEWQFIIGRGRWMGASPDAFKIDVNGITYEATPATNAWSSGGSNYVYIFEDPSSARKYHGLIKNVRVWHRILTDVECQLLYRFPWYGLEEDFGFGYLPVAAGGTSLPRFALNFGGGFAPHASLDGGLIT